jgi:signal transduction histidine kinase
MFLAVAAATAPVLVAQSFFLLEQQRSPGFLALFALLCLVVAGAAAGTMAHLLVERPVEGLAREARSAWSEGEAQEGTVEVSQVLEPVAEQVTILQGMLEDAVDEAEAASLEQEATEEELTRIRRLTFAGRVSASIAHEIGTPLSVIAGRARMIHEREVVGEEARASARIISEQAERIAAAVRGLLDFVRRGSVEVERVDLDAVVGRTLDLACIVARKRGVKIELALDEPAVRARADAVMLQQALTNLVLNGIKAMSRGGRLVVGTSLERAEPPDDARATGSEFACLFVSDEGGGIEPERIPRIFEPLHTDRQGGTGLGLSLTSDIVREMGGWLKVESDPGRGSRFAIYLAPDGAP